MLERHLEFPKSVGKGENGMALIHIFKIKDSIVVRSIYASNKDYNFEMDRNLNKVANEKRAPLPKGYDVIVPAFFYGLDDQPKEGDPIITPEAKKVVDEIGRDIEVTSHITMITFLK